MPLLALLLGLLACAAAGADTVLLHNGDRIQGRIVAQDAETLSLETDYAGVLHIRRDAIAAIEPPPAEAAQDSQPPADPEGAAPIPAGEEPAPAPRWRDRWSGSLDLGATWRSGNTDSLDAQSTAQFVREAKRNKLTLNLGAQYGEVADEINARAYRGEAKWQVYPRERLFIYFQGGAERDDGRKLDYRFTAGAGLGYDVIKRDRTQLSIEGGGEYAWERWNPFTPAERDRARVSRRAAAGDALAGYLGGGPIDREALGRIAGLLRDYRDPLAAFSPREEDYASLRIGLRYEQKLWKESVLANALTLLPNLGDFSEFRAENELSFTTPISPRLGLRVALSTAYDSLAENSGADPWDNRLVTGLSLKF